MHTFYEFFAGGGMARAGLGNEWHCLFANDIDEMKAAAYVDNWGSGHMFVADIADVEIGQLPGQADLAWASFPCQDLSLAGDYRGLGSEFSKRRTRSGTFWPFLDLIRKAGRCGRAPKTIVLENVYGTLTSNKGRDFSAIASALSASGYSFGALVIDGRYFVPQSRQRLFVVAIHQGISVPTNLRAFEADPRWHPRVLVNAFEALSKSAKQDWIWWKLPYPMGKVKSFAAIVEDKPTGVEWDSALNTRRLLALMSPTNRKKVREAQKKGKQVVGGVYRRTRFEDGKKVQRAEVRFDDIAGCLRTPRGGSSRQRILIVNNTSVRSRLLSPREAARLMGLPDTYKLPQKYNDAYHIAGDGVIVPVVNHLARHLLEPLLLAHQGSLQAAE